MQSLERIGILAMWPTLDKRPTIFAKTKVGLARDGEVDLGGCEGEVGGCSMSLGFGEFGVGGGS